MKKILVGVLGSTALLGACTGGSNPSGNNNYTNQTVKIVPSSIQVMTPMSSDANTSSAQALQSAKLTTTNSCIQLVQTNGQNYTTSISPSEWWSTANLTFTLKNTCSTGQQFSANVNLNNLQVNGAPATSVAVSGQTGSPYMSTSITNGSNPVVTVGTPACTGEWCSWAQLASGATTSITVQTTYSGRINSFTVSSVTVGGDTPLPGPTVNPSPSPSTSPTPTPPVATGAIDLSLDGTNLANICKSSSCNIKVNVVSAANVVVDTEYFNPAKQAKLGVRLDNLFVGDYTVVVDDDSLPSVSGNKVIYGYIPSAEVAVTKGNVASEQVSFKLAPIDQIYNLNVSLGGVSDNTLSGKAVYGQLINSKNVVVQTFNTTTSGGNVNLTTTESGSFTVKVQGVGNPKTGVYFGNIIKAVNIKDSNTAVSLSYAKLADDKLFAVNVGVTNPSDSQTMKFGSDDSWYVYDTTPATSGSLYFANSESTIAVTLSSVSGYTTTTTPSPLVISGAGNITINNEKNIAPDVNVNKVVTAYLLIDKMSTLEQYIKDLSAVSKPNFNRVIFSFVKPTLTDYTSGSLANTGILGYWDNGDGNGIAAFEKLKEAAKLSAEKNIQPFISVGGWNYSCNFEVYGTKCGAAPTATNGIHYDYFPDPTEASEKSIAEKSYANIIKLTNDLGMQGIDFDAEEFWHADKYAVAWQPGVSGEWSSEIGRSIVAAGGPTYANLMKFGAGSTAVSSGPAVMPKTVNKIVAILHALEDNPTAKNLMFSTAAPPVGARPITGFVYGDNVDDIYSKGGVWWLGNLKGLWYNLAASDKSVVDRFDSLGLMTYDLCGDNPDTCAPYGKGPLDLAGQVNAYMKDYNTWLKTESAGSLTVSDAGKVVYYPEHYNVKSKIQFGFEVNKPAYPQNEAGILQLTNSLVDTILSEQKNSGGVIIWQLYSVQNTAGNGTTSKYTMQQSCKIFLANDSRYDCNANFPSEVK